MSGLALPAPAPAPRLLVTPLIDRVALHLLLVCDILYMSRLYRIGGSTVVQPVLLATCSAVALAYTVLALAQRRYLEVSFQAAFFALIGAELLQFSRLAMVSVSLNAAFQYVLPATFIVFSTVIGNGQGRAVARGLFWYAFCYSMLYLALAVLYQLNLVDRGLLQPLILIDPERGERLFNHFVATGFCWFYCLHAVRRRPGLLAWVALLLLGLTIALTLSRVFILCMLLITALVVCRARSPTIRTVCLLILWGASLAYIWGMVDPSWNPFALFAGDTSGSVRADEYETARYFLTRNPLWGVGIAPAQQDIGDLTGDYYFAAGDLGAFGVWFDWGFFGLLILFAGSHVITRTIRGIGDDFGTPLFLTGCLLAAYGCISQTILYPPGATYFAVMLGYWLQRDVLARPGRAGCAPLPQPP